MKRGNREIFIVSKTGEIKRYIVKVSNQIIVQENDQVKAGTALSEGVITPEDMLNIKGAKAVQEYLVNEIKEVYRLQGVNINEKHFEIIVRQMMLKVKIVDAGDTRFLEDSIEHKTDFIEENNRIFGMKFVEDPGDSDKFKYGQLLNMVELRNENEFLDSIGKKPMIIRMTSPATGKPILQGITRAALHTKSFISAASFQETTKVLNEAAISGKTDNLLGLKENVIVGHKITAGTGLREYQDFIVFSKIKFDDIPLYEIQ
jgi:DNA-directed RNA polymerase subunit beta'